LDGFITAEIPASLRLAEKSDKGKKDKNDDKDGSCKKDDDKDNNSKNGKDENQLNTGQQTVTGAVYGPPGDGAAKDTKEGIAGVNPDTAQQETANTSDQNKPTAVEAVAPGNQADSGGEKDGNSNH
jgi:hypothetical protein